ncbi:MAG: helix-turn-helix transcriptional regulator [Candidatus Marinimicrobia bacterium]|nr:helix-turn-helix transcriptional regulator [Candidatus Neomarinimicrobiota bacterium]
MTDIVKIIGSNIHRYRLALGLSQEKLAANSGLHRTYIGAVERGERNISARNIEKIATALGVEPHILLMRNV